MRKYIKPGWMISSRAFLCLCHCEEVRRSNPVAVHVRYALAKGLPRYARNDKVGLILYHYLFPFIRENTITGAILFKYQ